MEGSYGIGACGESTIEIDSIDIIDVENNMLHPIVGLQDNNHYSIEPVHFQSLPSNHLYDFIAYTPAGPLPMGNPRSKDELINAVENDLYFPCPDPEKRKAYNPVKVYPNPTSNSIKIEMSLPRNYSGVISTLEGEILMQTENMNAMGTISLVHLSSGIYILNITHWESGQQYQFKIVKY